jgi:adenine C2-methylase RlmN of 23S rRNA A2503 and tRNA A37
MVGMGEPVRPKLAISLNVSSAGNWRLLANLNCALNLMALNPGPGIPYESPDPEQVASFQAVVRRSFPCFIRKPRGRNIFAACGQLKQVSMEPRA